MKRKKTPRIQEVEASTEQRLLIGCLDTVASGRRISMQRSTDSKRERYSNITKSFDKSPLFFQIYQTRLVVYWMLLNIWTCFGYKSGSL